MFINLLPPQDASFLQQASPEDTTKNFTNGINFYETQRRLFKLNVKGLTANYRMELATRLLFAEFLIQQKKYDKAGEQIQEIKRLAEDAKGKCEVEINLDKCKQLLTKIDELGRLKLSKQEDQKAIE